jgi:hypothetical protein
MFFVSELIGIISVFKSKEEYELRNYRTVAIVASHFWSKNIKQTTAIIHCTCYRKKSLINVKFSESAACLRKVILQ